MAVTPVLLTGSGTGTDGPTATTASINPAGWPVLAFLVVTVATTAPSAPVLSSNTGTGTWTVLADSVQASAATARSMFAYVGTNLTSAGTILITKNVADADLTGFNWSFYKLVGATELPYVQSKSAVDTDWDLADTVTATLAAAVRTNNRCIAAAFLNVTTDTLVQGTGLTELDEHATTTPSLELHTSWTAGAPQTGASYTQTSGDNVVGGVITVEIQATGGLSTTGAGF